MTPLRLNHRSFDRSAPTGPFGRLRRRVFAAAAALGACLALLSGCTDSSSLNRGEVSGVVLLDGQPAKGGTIVFRPTAENTKGVTAGAEIVNGSYYIPRRIGPTAGDNNVQFVGAMPSGRKTSGRGGEEDEYVDVFPEKFGQRSSEVRRVVAGKNIFDFDLKSK